MKELLIELQPLIYQAVIVVLTTLGTYLGAKAKKYIDYKRMVEIVEKTVEYVEELGYQDELLKGQAKFELAKQRTFEWLEQQGIPYVEIQVEILINALVKEIRDNEKEIE